jgi:hypothetical protein
MKLADVIAKRLYEELGKLGKDSGVKWNVHEDEFLPANVMCDYAGQCRFINMMSSVIAEELERVKTQI